MLFYAGLVEANYGNWPALELQPVTGASVTIEYRASDVEQIRADAQASRATFNAADASGSVAHLVVASVERCAWCPFQVVCPALGRDWSAVASSRHRAVTLARGIVSAVRRQDQSTDVVLEQRTDLTAPAGTVTVTRLPHESDIRVGDEFSVSRVALAGNDHVLRAGWDSLIWVHRPGPPQ